MAKEENKYGVVERFTKLEVVEIARRTENRVTWANGDSWKWAPIGSLLGTFPSKTLASAAATAARKNQSTMSDRQLKAVVKACVGYAK